MTTRRYVVIGSGVASISAVEAIRSQDRSGEIIMISDDPHGYYSRPGLAYYLTGEVEERYLYPYHKADFIRLQVNRLRGRAVRIDQAAHQVYLSDGRIQPYDRLLVAVGAQAILPDMDRIAIQGVVKLDDLEDARQMVQLARRARTAVVVGGGITALEIVEGLIAHKVDVHYFLRGDRYWGNVLDDKESAIIEQRLQSEGVHLHYKTELQAVEEKNGRLVAVRTRDGRLIKTDLLAVAIGIQPRLTLAINSGLMTGKGIRVNETMLTNANDIFAAGDVAEVVDSAGNAAMNTLWGPAREQGRIAGLNMAGSSARYTRAPAFNVTRLAGVTTTIIGSVGMGKDMDIVGIARGDSETWRQIPDAIVVQNDFEVNRLRLMIGDKALVGAVLMGDQTLSQPIQHMVSQQVDVTAIREQLLAQQESLGDVLASFWAQWRQNGRKQIS